ncbi:MAG: histidine kinase dimerization/phosphoacceptor domain -containing protein [Chitinophagaceae bacterium]
MKRISVVILSLCLVLDSHGQDEERIRANILLASLAGDKPVNERLNTLLRLAEFHNFKPREEKEDLDSAAVLIADAKGLAAELNSSDALASIAVVESCLLRERGQKYEAREMVEKAVRDLGNSKPCFYSGRACFEAASYYNYEVPEQLAKKITLVEQAEMAFRLAGETEWRANSLKMLADLYTIKGEFARAMVTIKLALETYGSINCKRLQSVYAVMGRIYGIRPDPDYRQALHCEMEAIRICNAMGDSTMQLCEIYNIVGHLYGAGENPELALRYYKKAIAISQRYNDNRATVQIALSITITNVNADRPAEALSFLNSLQRSKIKSTEKPCIIPMAYLLTYISLNQYSQCKPFYDQLLKGLKTGFPAEMELNMAYRLMAKYNIGIRQFRQAHYYLNKNREGVRTDSPLRRSKDLYVWFQLDSASGNYKSAMNSLLEYKRLNDSIHNVTRLRQIQQLEVEYESEKKENALKMKDKDILVLNQDNQLQKTHLRQVNLVKNVTFCGIVLLFVITGLLFNQFRHKQQSNLVISQKNDLLQNLLAEKEWLLKEVHHRVKNTLHTVICLLESQSAFLKDDARSANEISQQRIYAMSLIHQKIYQTDDIKTIDTAQYLPEFIRYLDDSFGNDRRIDLQIAIDPVQLDISQAVPVALIINEAVTNSFKYAFPRDRRGTIEIKLERQGNKINLVIADNGIGISSELINASSNSLGLQLIKGLGQDLKATVNIENRGGTQISIVFDYVINGDDQLLKALKDTKMFKC